MALTFIGITQVEREPFSEAAKTVEGTCGHRDALALGSPTGPVLLDAKASDGGSAWPGLASER